MQVSADAGACAVGGTCACVVIRGWCGCCRPGAGAGADKAKLASCYRGTQPGTEQERSQVVGGGAQAGAEKTRLGGTENGRLSPPYFEGAVPLRLARPLPRPAPSNHTHPRNAVNLEPGPKHITIATPQPHGGPAIVSRETFHLPQAMGLHRDIFGKASCTRFIQDNWH